MLNHKLLLPNKEQALPGREEPIPITNRHYVSGLPIKPPYERTNLETIVLGLGCFWGAERLFWQTEGVYTTAVGYTAGLTPNPSYQEVCTGLTGHNEVVQVVFDPAKVSLRQLLTIFFESHDPTQGMRQGNDQGTQYRSGIYYLNDQQNECATQVQADYQQRLSDQGYPQITTEILELKAFYYAEDYHQQYLAKNPSGYCGLAGTGVSCAG